MKTEIKTSIRLEESVIERVKTQVKINGYKSASDFMRQAILEKLDRQQLGTLIEKMLEEQSKLHGALVGTIKIFAERDKKHADAEENIRSSLSQIANSLSNIS